MHAFTLSLSVSLRLRIYCTPSIMYTAPCNAGVCVCTVFMSHSVASLTAIFRQGWLHWKGTLSPCSCPPMVSAHYVSKQKPQGLLGTGMGDDVCVSYVSLYICELTDFVDWIWERAYIWEEFLKCSFLLMTTVFDRHEVTMVGSRGVKSKWLSN